MLRSLAILILGLTACRTPPTGLSSPPLGASTGCDSSTGSVAPLGTASPTIVTATSPDGRWVVACQARSDTNRDGVLEVWTDDDGQPRGDIMEQYLFLGATERKLDAYAGGDPSGRYVALVRNDELFLTDTLTGQDLNLSFRDADHEDDALLPRHRAVDFDSASTRMLWIRRDPVRAIAVVRNLGTGEERALDLGPGRVWYGFFQGDWIFIATATDTNLDGAIAFPGGPNRGNPRRCRANEDSRGAGDRITWYAVHADGGEPRPISGPLLLHGDTFHSGGKPGRTEGLATAFGEELLLTGPAGELWLESRAGIRSDFLPSAERPEIVAIDSNRGILIASSGPDACRRLQVLKNGYRRGLGDCERGSHSELPSRFTVKSSLLPLRFRYLDVDRESIRWRLPWDAYLKYSHGRRVLLEAGRLFSYDLDSEVSTPILEVELDHEFLSAGPYVYSRGELLDLTAATHLGRVEGVAQAISGDGRVLILDPPPGWQAGEKPHPVTEMESRRVAAFGPLRWVRPVRPATRTP